jgi:hypothetical protein
MPAKPTISLRVRHIAVLAGLALCSFVAIAQADDRGVCGSVPPKSAAAAACSRIIASPSTSPHDRALAYTFRAEVKRKEPDLAGAIEDYNQALTLLPDYLPALVGRGAAKHATGDAAGGDADIARAKALDPAVTVPQ